MALRDSFPEGVKNPLLEEEEVPMNDEGMESEPVVDEPTPATNEPTPEPEPITEIPNNDVAPTVEQPPYQPPVGITKEDLQAMLNETLVNQTQPKEEVKQPTEEEVEAEKEKWMDNFYSNPMEAINNIVKEAIKPYQERIEEQDKQMEWGNKAKQFLDNRPDAKDLIEDIVEVLNNKPALQDEEDAYETAYKLIQADKLMNKPEKEFTVEDAMQNEDFKKAVIDEYLSKLNSQENPPTLIGKQSGQAPLSAGEKPKTLKEATRMYLGRK